MTSPSSGSGLRWNAWNLLLLVPFLMLVTPWFNADQPRVFGLPVFYWVQFLFVPVGVVCVAVVHLMTRKAPTVPAPGKPAGPDDLDEGALR